MQSKTFQKSVLTLEVGPGLTRKKIVGKSSQNSPIPVLIFWTSIPCLHTLLTVVSHYDLSVLSMSVMGFQNKLIGVGWGGWGELYSVLFWNFGIFQTAKPLIQWNFTISVTHGTWQEWP